jgi:hypothetical protein
VKVTVVVNEAGKVVAAHVPFAITDTSAADEGPTLGFVASEGEEVVELDLSDEEVPRDPEPEFLEFLQRRKDG